MIGIYQGNLRCNMFLVVLDIFFFSWLFVICISLVWLLIANTYSRVYIIS